MDAEDIITSLHPLERKVVPVLKNNKDFDAIVKKSGLKDVEVMRALQWLQNKDIIKIDEESFKVISLDKNGKSYAEKGLPERRFLEALENTASLEEISKKANLEKEEASVCIGLLKKKGAIELGDNMQISLTDNGKKLKTNKFLEEKFIVKLKKKNELSYEELSDEDKYCYDILQKRREIVKTDSIKKRHIELTDLGEEIVKTKMESAENVIEKLTSEIIKDESWKKKKFRGYDVAANVPKISGGKRHFVRDANEYIKQIWLDLGFEEMTGPMATTAFWDLDSLFVPQDHPARSMQDTFYVKDMNTDNKVLEGNLPSPFFKIIKEIHETGGDTGSKGWPGKWSEDEAKQVMLRTHTTVLSALKLYELKEEDLPKKFFVVGKVFRNETVDWKHAFEFEQVDGIVIDKDVTLSHLFGYLKQFFKKMGFDQIRLRPAHFPYTEPSVEVDVFHPEKEEWVELGGAGIFRPEVVKPLLGIDIPVLAWGIGFGRVLTEYYGITDLRDLSKNDLQQIKNMKRWLRY